MSLKLSVELNEAVSLLNIAADSLVKDEYSLSFNQFQLLYVLGGLEPTSQARIAEYMGQSRSAITKSLRKLVARDLINVDIDENNSTRNTVTLSKKGASIKNEAAKMLEHEFQQLLSTAPIDVRAMQGDISIIKKLLEEYLHEK